MPRIQLPTRYVPRHLTKKDRRRQVQMVLQSRKQYKTQHYDTRQKLGSFRNKKSNHIARARQLYQINTIAPTRELAVKTGCSLAALQHIVRKGEGAYYSSGSRPNQTPQSWGLARLASALTAGKAAAVDYDILEKGCQHTRTKTAFRLAQRARRQFNYGHSKTKKSSFTR